MLTKTRLLKEIDKLPEVFSIEELVERLIFIEKVENGIKQSEAGNIVSEEELIRYVNQLFVDQ